MISPALRPSPATGAESLISPAMGGTLARVEPDCAGHFLFSEAAHQLRAHDTNGHHAAPVRLGAAGKVLRKSSPRPFPSSQVDDFTHRDGSCSLLRIGEHKEKAFHDLGKIIHARAG